MRLPAFSTMRARLLTWMMVLMLLPVLLLVVLGLGYAERQLESSVTQDLRYALRILNITLDTRVDVQLEDNRILSRSPYLQQALTEFSAIFRPGSSYNNDYQALEDKYWTYLAYYAEKQNMTDLLLVNPAGYVVFSASQSALYGKNLRHVDFANTALRKAFELSLWQMDSVLEVSTEDSGYYAALASPVVGDRLLGVVIQIPSPEVINGMLEHGDTDSDLYQALYLAAPDGVFRQLRTRDLTVAGSPLNRALSAAYLGQDVDTELDIWGEPWLVSLKPLPALNGVVMVRQRKASALAAVHDIRVSAWLGSAVFMVLLVLVVRSVSNNLTRPLKHLASQFEKVGAGQRQVRVDENRRDELGMLAREFNKMAESLRNTQAQLVQSEKMASIGHLAAGVAHEINNPMSIVTANIDTMRQYTEVYVMLVDLYDKYIGAVTSGEAENAEKLAADIIRYQREEDIGFVYDDMKGLLEDSLQGLARVKHIVGSLRVFSELDKAEEQQVDLNECLHHVVAGLDSKLKSRVNIQFDVRLTAPVSFKLEQMRKVFAAIIDNACKACDDGGNVHIRAWSESNRTLIEVEDNGAGIDEARMPHIFDPFFTTRAVGEGLGLGLSMAHSIVEAHGGSIQVVSQPEKGTRVQISLPQTPLKAVA
ncbi:sensor histidine kinase [Thalassolituus sp. LLYu03]|uniref:sensor histidine kinase n=1 Tax=Thalassolituus sp. LLYu03 TaxID=3421656 RepID=UPI003D2B9946